MRTVETIEEVFEQFEEDFLQRPELKLFFKRQEQTKKIAQASKQLLLEAIEKTDEHTFVQLGKKHYQMGIPYPLLCDALNFLEKQFTRLAIYNKVDPIKIQRFIDTIAQIENFLAQGYFIEDFRHFVQDLTAVYTNMPSYVDLKELIQWHLRWLSELGEIITHLPIDEDRFNEFIKKPCYFEQNLQKVIEEHKLDQIDIQKLIDTHTAFHKSVFVLHYTLIHREFTRSFTILQQLKLHSYEIESILFMLNIIDISDRAKYDPLTGALARNMIEPILKRELELHKISQSPIAIAMIDVDDFKKINDTYGHLCGDFVLKELVARIKKVLRGSDYVFRYGGEEFMILLTNVEEESLYSILNKIRLAVASTPFEHEECKLNVTISIGATLVKDEDITHFIKLADENLYAAKRAGKNRVVL